ncbi:MAG: DUF1501 domain-containing protein [Planctomycetes bacterium]|nr:DUF1501 domain-containing protein [Planctomycetota bacterium]
MLSNLFAQQQLRNRRWFLRDCSVGLGAIALNGLLADGAEPLPKPHHAPKAKRVIYLFMGGAPSHLELFDNKPQLAKFNGTLPPPELLKNYRAAFINPNSKLLGPKFAFKKVGKNGTELGVLLPHLGEVVDDIAIVKSMTTDAFNHAPAQIMTLTGNQQFGRPSIGSWVTYGLGSESKELPGFVVFSSGSKGPSGGNSCWGSGFLPSSHAGTLFRSAGDPVLFLGNPAGVDAEMQKDSLDAIKALNEKRLGVVGDPEIAARISAYEMAGRMQTSAPELMDLSKESKKTLDMYGAKPGEPSFASNCVLARRLIERGVRFVQLFHEAWDHHGGLTNGLKAECGKTDRASAALVRDLKQRGLLDDTLVIWGGEFGRTPMVQGGDDGRDHHPNCYSIWMAGGGVKPGLVLGSSDELGFNTAENKVHVHDLNATILRLLGFDHTKLTFRSQGRDFRLTDVHGHVVEKLLA